MKKQKIKPSSGTGANYFMKKSELGRFGGMVKHYEKARRPYPVEIFRFLKGKIRIKNPLILDLGCGTGISTRQLAKLKLGSVIGCDPDPIMLRYARKHSQAGIKKYVKARADKLPFPDKTFDVVTAFSAFHWFDDERSLSEIRRVLKPGGLLFTANRSGTKSWGEGYRRAIMAAINRKVAQFAKAKGYDPVKTLQESRFKSVRKKSWKKAEAYTLKGALDYVQAVSIWNSVSEQLREKALIGVEKHFRKIRKKRGKIVRDLAAYVVFGKK